MKRIGAIALEVGIYSAIAFFVAYVGILQIFVVQFALRKRLSKKTHKMGTFGFWMTIFNSAKYTLFSHM